ncbi:hypothetical protein ACFLZ9_00750 [Patescibacteria group bacterium]
MSLFKQTRDYIKKYFIYGIHGHKYVPRELFDMMRYFKNNGAINFEYKEEKDCIVAISTNFIYGSIVTSGKNKKELDKNIKDAILTSFDIPSSYAKEAAIKREGELQSAYASA